MTEIKYPMLEKSDSNCKLLQDADKCDKYDYLTAEAWGVVGGIVDIFLEGVPGDSKLGNWSDEQIDNVLISIP